MNLYSAMSWLSESKKTLGSSFVLFAKSSNYFFIKYSYCKNIP